jgi:hypothetical protein
VNRGVINCDSMAVKVRSGVFVMKREIRCWRSAHGGHRRGCEADDKAEIYGLMVS